MTPAESDALAGVVVNLLKANLAPILADVVSLKDQLANWEARWNDYGALRERIAIVETKALQTPPAVLPTVVEGPPGPPGRDGTPGEPGPPGDRGADGAAGKDGLDGKDAAPGRDGRDGLPGVPGQPGEKGMNGKDGTNGIDGKDGLGVDDLTVEPVDERSFVLKAVSGDRVKTCGTVTFPVQINRGVYQSGHAYEKGDVVTWGGSQWYAKEATTTKPGEVIGAAHWILVVKRGRDGRDGKDGKDAGLPVVSVR